MTFIYICFYPLTCISDALMSLVLIVFSVMIFVHIACVYFPVLSFRVYYWIHVLIIELICRIECKLLERYVSCVVYLAQLFWYWAAFSVNYVLLLTRYFYRVWFESWDIKGSWIISAHIFEFNFEVLNSWVSSDLDKWQCSDPSIPFVVL